jgi:hypothetical protein
MAEPKRHKGGTLKESEIQREILEYLATQDDVFMWRSQSTGVFNPVSGTWRKLQGIGRIQGVSDILGVLGSVGISEGNLVGCGRFLAIEVKSRYGKATPDQENFLLQVNNRGGLGFIARSVEDVVTQLAHHRAALAWSQVGKSVEVLEV